MGATERNLATCYRIYCERCVVLHDPERRRSLHGTWVDDRSDSELVRNDVLSQVERRLGLAKRLPRSRIILSSVVPKELADETKLELFDPLPAARAEVVVVRNFSSPEELRACSDFEATLESRFKGSELGYVDGNDIGDCVYAIYA